MCEKPAAGDSQGIAEEEENRARRESGFSQPNSGRVEVRQRKMKESVCESKSSGCRVWISFPFQFQLVSKFIFAAFWVIKNRLCVGGSVALISDN